MNEKPTQDEMDIQTVMSTEAGRRFVQSLITASGVNHDSFDPEPTKHAYYAGRRAMGLIVGTTVQNAAHELYLMMIKEHFDE